jgi:flavin reductase (DIM6/NTAB) family NADH-FMN oxidoreductase RutF
MFIVTGAPDSPLKQDPFKAVVVPRPIGWISSLGADGVVNLAPYSFFNAISENPPSVMYATTGFAPGGAVKDSRRNIEASGEFVVNLATWDLREAVRLSGKAVPPEESEMALAGLESLPSRLVRPPRVAASPVHLECRWLKTIHVPDTVGPDETHMVLGRVVGIHIRDDVIVDGRVDPARLRPIARLGYHDYAVVERIFTMTFL